MKETKFNSIIAEMLGVQALEKCAGYIPNTKL